MGTREAGFTSSLPGYRKFESAADREELAAFWGIDEERIPTSRGWAYPDIIEGAVAKKIRALWIIATNPVVSFPNLGVLQQSLDSLDFLVVQDGFHPTPTTEIADLVLPAAIWGEKEGTYTNSERRVSKVNRAVAAPGEARTDFDIFLELAKKLGCYDELFPGWTAAQGRLRRMEDEFQRGAFVTTPGISYELLEQSRRDSVAVSGKDATEVKTTRLYSDGKFSDRRWKGSAALRRMGAFPGTAECRLPVCPEYRAHGGTLAHPDQDRESADPRTPVSERMAGNESA